MAHELQERAMPASRACRPAAGARVEHEQGEDPLYIPPWMNHEMWMNHEL